MKEEDRMALSLFRHQVKREEYDHDRFTPVIRSSICTGEKVAGFKDRETGKIEEIMLIRSREDLEAFQQRYGIEGEIQTIY